MVDFTKDPQYQRAIQRIMSMSPEQKAVLDTAIVDKKFASQDMRRRLDGMRSEATRLSNERSLGLRRRQFETKKGELPKLERIGYGEVAVSGLMGLAGLSQGRRQAEKLERESILNNTFRARMEDIYSGTVDKKKRLGLAVNEPSLWE